MQDKELYNLIAAKIRELRKDFGGKGISQEELASEMKVLPNTVSRWETGKYKPNINDLRNLADFFGISIADFFPKEEQTPKKDKMKALTRLSGELPDEDLEELIEYAKYKRARKRLTKNKK